MNVEMNKGWYNFMYMYNDRSVEDNLRMGSEKSEEAVEVLEEFVTFQFLRVA